MGKSSRKKRKAPGEAGADITRPKASQGFPDTVLARGSLSRSIRKTSAYSLAAAVSLITFVVYLSSLQNDFIFQWDDGLYVVDNPFIRSLNLTLLKRAFLDFYAANWHPLTWLSHALDYFIWGLNPLGHHLTNNILHAGNTFLVVVLAIRLMDIAKERAGDEGLSGFLGDRAMYITGGVSGLLFGLHPLHVESVAWVAERKDLLCTLFFLLSIIAYTKYAGKTALSAPAGTRLLDRQYLVALVFFSLALLSKPMAVTLPAVLLIGDWYPFNRVRSMRSFWSACIEKVPFFVLSLFSSVLTILAQKAGEAMAMMEIVPLSERMLVAAKSFITYPWKIVVPVNLIPYYPYPNNVSLYSLEYLSAVVLVAVITAACAGLAKKQKVWLSAWSYYVVTLLPVIGIVQVGGQAMADRYTYIPSLGPFLVIGVSLAWMSGKVNLVMKWDLRAKILSVVAALFFFVPVTYLTIEQLRIWKNGITLWSHVIEKQPSGIAHAYMNRGLTFVGKGQLDEAIKDFDKAVALNPSFYEAYSNRGGAFEKMGRLDRAVEDFNRAIALNPRYANAYFNRGVAYGKAGSYDDSIASFNKSLEIDPGKVDAYVSRGVSYALMGQQEKALTDFNMAIELNQNYAQAYFNRGNLYVTTGRKNLAIPDFQRACDLGDQRGCGALKAGGR